MLITEAVKQRDKTVDFIVTTNNTNLTNLDFVSEYIESKSENWEKHSSLYILSIKQRIHILNGWRYAVVAVYRISNNLI